MLTSFYDSVLYQATIKGMDASAMRQKVIANNIANVDPPHFKRVEVNFEDAFKQALEKKPNRLMGFRTDKQHIPINKNIDFHNVKPTMWRQNDTYSRSDDNNVDMDVEMVDVAKNELMMNSLVETLNRKMQQISWSINGRSS